MQATMPRKGLRTELEELLGTPHQVELSVGAVTVTPLKFGDLPELLACLDAQQEESGGAAFSRLLELSTGLQADFIASLGEEDLIALMAASKAANPSIYREAPASARMPSGARAKGGILDSVALLIESGHTLEDIKGYTLSQIECLGLAHARLEAERRINDLCLARAAQADGKGFKNTVARLEQSLKRLS